MNRDELIAALQALPGAASTATVVFVVDEFRDATIDTVDYEYGEILLNIERGDVPDVEDEDED